MLETKNTVHTGDMGLGSHKKWLITVLL